MSKIPLRNMVGDLKGLGPQTALVLAAAVLLELCQLVSPLMLRLVVDKVAFHASHRLVFELFILFAGFGIIQAIFVAGRSRALIGLSERLNTNWLSSLFDRAMTLPASYFESRGVTAVAGKFWSVSYMQRVLTAAFLEGMLDGLMAVMALVLVFYYAPAAGALVAIALSVYGGFRWRTYRKQYEADAARADLALSQQSYLWETIASIQTVRLNRYEGKRKHLWFTELRKLFTADSRFQVAESQSRAALVGITSLTRVAVITALAMRVVDGSMTAGGLVAVVAYCEMCTSRGAALVERLVGFRLLDVHRAKVSELVNTPEDPLGCGRGEVTLEDRGGSIQLIDATLSVADGHDLVRSANIKVGPGECIAIVGPSGAGKSTLLRAMLGVVRLTSGELRIGGQLIESLSRSSYWCEVGTVLVQDRLFRASVVENVRLACDCTEDWVVECVRGVGLHDTIMRLPDGYDTVIKDDDVRLSAGERQRLLIARALCRKPKYLFLDEATSNLDTVSEQLVIEKLRSLRVTIVLVTHRPAPLSLASRIYRVDSGKLELCETGTAVISQHVVSD